MTTRAIREALATLQGYANAGDHDGDWNLALAARAEVEAIEKALMIWDDPSAGSDDWRTMVRCFKRIAGEARQRNAGTAGLNDGLSGVRFGAGVIKVGANGPQE